MAFIWNDEYNVGIEIIDKQHRHFIDLIEKFHTAIETINLEKELETLLDDLVIYAKYHFKTEEFYFDLYQYEFAQEHKEAHKNLLQKTIDFQEKYKKEHVVPLEELAEFLEDWLIDHLGTQDRKYIQCFHEHGLF